MDDLLSQSSAMPIDDIRAARLNDDDPYRQATLKRISLLKASDKQFLDAAPSADVSEAARSTKLSAAQVIETFLLGYAGRPALGSRRRDSSVDPVSGERVLRYSDSFETITYSELHGLIDNLRATWASLAGIIRPGDFVATLGNTGVEYAVIDLACTLSGLVTVPLHSTFTSHQVVSMTLETRPRIFAVSIDYLLIAAEAVAQCSTIQHMVVFDYIVGVDAHEVALAEAQARLQVDAPNVTVRTFTEEVAIGQGLPPLPVYVPATGDDPIATVMYTSGSTGTPKGAAHRSSLIRDVWWYPLARPNSEIPTLNYHMVSLSHVGGRGWLAATLSAGGTGYFETKSDHSWFWEDVALVRPTELIMIPLLCDILVERLHMEERNLLAAGVDRTSAYRQAQLTLRSDILGGRVLSAACGSAPLSPMSRDLLESCLETHIVDMYGTTELGTIIMNDGVLRQPPVVDYKLVELTADNFSAAGITYPCGELFIKSETLFSGYFEHPAATAKVFDSDGFYKTGDIMAEIAPGRLMYIDRATNILKLSAMGFVTVSRLEAAYCSASEIEQIYIYGNSARQFVLAVVVPNLELAGSEEVADIVSSALHRIAKENCFAPHEVPRKFIIAGEPFSIENGFLSVSGKLQRGPLKTRYGTELEMMYDEILQADFFETS